MECYVAAIAGADNPTKKSKAHRDLILERLNGLEEQRRPHGRQRGRKDNENGGMTQD
jgi:hypothetical protein